MQLHFFYTTCIPYNLLNIKKQYYTDILQTTTEALSLETAYNSLLRIKNTSRYTSVPIKKIMFSNRAQSYIPEIYKVYEYSKNICLKPSYGIPQISHRFWLFNKKTSFPSKLQLLESYFSIKKFYTSSQTKWTHLLWSNNPELLRTFFTENNYQHLLHTLIIISPYNLLHKNFLDICKKTEILASISVCSDLLKYIVLNKYGGIYLDLDYKIENYYIELHKLAKSYLPKSPYGDFGNAIMAAIPYHPYNEYNQDVMLNLILKTEYEDIKFLTGIQKTMYFNIQKMAYTKYFTVSTKNYLTDDIYVPHESIYTIFTTEECNFHIILNDMILNLCILGTDLQVGSWYDGDHIKLKTELGEMKKHIQDLELSLKESVDKLEDLSWSCANEIFDSEGIIF